MKKYYEQLYNANEELECEVQILSDEIEKLNDKLKVYQKHNDVLKKAFYKLSKRLNECD